MAPLVKLAVQILLGTTLVTDNSYSIHKAETTPRPHHDVETFAPLLRSAISLSSVSWGYNRLDVFGAGGEVPAVQHKYWDGYQWNPSGKDLESLSSKVTNPPVAVSWGKDRTDIFKVGLDKSVYHKYWDGSRWNPSKPEDWDSLGGDFALVMPSPQPHGAIIASMSTASDWTRMINMQYGTNIGMVPHGAQAAAQVGSTSEATSSANLLHSRAGLVYSTLWLLTRVIISYTNSSTVANGLSGKYLAKNSTALQPGSLGIKIA